MTSFQIPGAHLRDLWASGFVRARDVAIAGCRVSYMAQNPVRLVPDPIPLPVVNPLPRQATAVGAGTTSSAAPTASSIVVLRDILDNGFVNFCRRLAGSSLGALVQPAKQSRSRLCVSLSALCSWFIHADEPKRGRLPDDGKPQFKHAKSTARDGNYAC